MECRLKHLLAGCEARGWHVLWRIMPSFFLKGPGCYWGPWYYMLEYDRLYTYEWRGAFIVRILTIRDVSLLVYACFKETPRGLMYSRSLQYQSTQLFIACTYGWLTGAPCVTICRAPCSADPYNTKSSQLFIARGLLQGRNNISAPYRADLTTPNRLSCSTIA